MMMYPGGGDALLALIHREKSEERLDLFDAERERETKLWSSSLLVGF